jgi:hypothetical protein
MDMKIEQYLLNDPWLIENNQERNEKLLESNESENTTNQNF